MPLKIYGELDHFQRTFTVAGIQRERGVKQCAKCERASGIIRLGRETNERVSRNAHMLLFSKSAGRHRRHFYLEDQNETS